jgi:hypothetical protein
MQPTGESPPRPLVVYVSDDRAGVTFALEPRVRRTLQARFVGSHPSPRVFIGQETRAAFEEMHPILRQVLLILTGVSEERLRELGPVEFREPVTERVLKELTA